ncbi:MAG: hypothetical protein K2G91_09905 [Prevotella sp.]|nr:hypothetical protein [Prevotella sp.]
MTACTSCLSCTIIRSWEGFLSLWSNWLTVLHTVSSSFRIVCGLQATRLEAPSTRNVMGVI